MVSISRSLAQRFLAVVRRASSRRAGGQAIGLVRLLASNDSLSLQATNGTVAIEYRKGGQFENADITVPLRLFADCAAKDESSVSIRVRDQRIIAEWTDRGVPQRRDYDIPPTSCEIPNTPDEFVETDPHLSSALKDAAATVDPGASRYALNCVQLDGTNGSISATDSRQLLSQSGFSFPWTEKLLMRCSPVFASAEFLTGTLTAIGRTDQHIVVRMGRWTIHHEIDLKGRFPNTDQIIPNPSAVTTRMQVDAPDARFIVDTIARLPADDSGHRPLTIDLNGSVVLRARKDQQSPPVELILNQSKRVGDELRVNVSRTHLARAFQLGFTEVGFVGAAKPCVCRDPNRTYVWMPLEESGAFPTGPDAIRFNSVSSPTPVAAESVDTSVEASKATERSVEQRPSEVKRIKRVNKHLTSQLPPNVVSVIETPATNATSVPRDVLDQANDLRDQLRSVLQGLSELVAQMRQQRKSARLVKSTLRSLKQIQLLDA